MKDLLLIITTISVISCNGQKPNNVKQFEEHMNSNFLVVKSDNKKFHAILDVNLRDSIITYQTPMGSLVGKKYSKSRNQIRLMPIKNIHPQGIFYYDEDKLIKIYSRENKPGFFNNISSDKKLRWRSEEHDTEFCAFIMKKDYNLAKFKELKVLFASVIKSLNQNIPLAEKPPIKGLSKPEYKNYRNRTLHLKSKLESTVLVLPTASVHIKPVIDNLSFHESRRLFETEMKQKLNYQNVSLKGNLRGFILVGNNGNVIEVLQEESGSTYTVRNPDFEKNALEFRNWTPAIHNDKEVVCKIKYFIRKEDWD